MAELKTKRTKQSVAAFIKSIPEEQKRRDAQTISKLMKRATNSDPEMWGGNIVGFGSYHYRYASGREGDWFVTGFSPRKRNLTLYIMSGFSQYNTLMKKLGKHTTGKSCLYIKRLADVDIPTLEKLIRESVKHVKMTYR